MVVKRVCEIKIYMVLGVCENKIKMEGDTQQEMNSLAPSIYLSLSISHKTLHMMMIAVIWYAQTYHMRSLLSMIPI